MKKNSEQLTLTAFKPFLAITIAILILILLYDAFIAYEKQRGSTFLVVSAFLVKLISISYSLFYLSLTVDILRRNKRLFGDKYIKGIGAMKKLQEDTKTDDFVFSGKTIFVSFGMIVLISFWVFKMNFILFLLLIPVSTLIWSYFRMNQPPTAIYLSSSKNENNLYYHNDFKLFISPFRVVTLLEYNPKNQYENNKLYNNIKLDVLRNIFEDDFESKVDGILNITKIIIVSTLYPTKYTIREVELIVERKYLYKTFFLTNCSRDIPLIEKTSYLWNEDTIPLRCIGVYNDLFKCIKHIILEHHSLTPEFTMNYCLQSIKNSNSFPFKSTAVEELVKKGNYLLSKGKFIEAEKYLNESLCHTIQKQEIIWTNLAIISLNISNLNEAEDRIQKALQINNTHPNSLYTAGLVYEMLDQRIKAINFYEKFLATSSLRNKIQVNDANIRMSKLKTKIK